MTEPQITVSHVRLSSHRCLPGGVAAWADIAITAKNGTVHEWQNCRLVFDGFWLADIPIGSYSLYVPGEYRRSYTRGTKLIPPCWRRAARWAVYDAAAAEEEKQKQEIADGTRWKPLPLSAIQSAQAGGTRTW